MIRLLPERYPKKRVRCIDVVNAYGFVLEKAMRLGPVTVAQAKLPYDKPIIKAAIVDGAKQPGMKTEQLKLLAEGYVSLGFFVDDRDRLGGPFPNRAPVTGKQIAGFFKNHGGLLAKDTCAGQMVADEMAQLSSEWASFVSQGMN